MNTNLDLQDKTIVITGATSGIGQAAMRALARRGAYVIGVGRSQHRAAEAEQIIRAETPDARIAFAIADLSTQRAVRALAADLRGLAAGRIDALVNNAGTVATWYTATEDGYELQFAVNHLAPFLLTHELMPLLEASPAGKVITVSSGSHYRTRIHWADVMYRRHYNVLAAYKQSKMANVLFTAELNRRLGSTNRVRAFAVDPGLVNTTIGMKGTTGVQKWVWEMRRRGGVTPEQGAETVVYLAASRSFYDRSAIYWKNCQPTDPDPYALNEAEAARLWELSARLCGIAEMPQSTVPVATLTPQFA